MQTEIIKIVVNNTSYGSNLLMHIWVFWGTLHSFLQEQKPRMLQWVFKKESLSQRCASGGPQKFVDVFPCRPSRWSTIWFCGAFPPFWGEQTNWNL